MAAYHVRSNSFPPSPHPLVPQFDEQLCRLRASVCASSSTSTSMACQGSGLQDLPWLRKFCHKQRIPHKNFNQSFEEDEVAKCGQRTTTVKKAIQKAIKNLKEMGNRCIFNTLNKDNETVAILNLLREAEAITLIILESLLLFISEPNLGGSKPNKW
ncbi:uncharacterized protein LOC132800362 [Ziziphus jujuba]|uniref:Uncharacterized protein LOC132800362 n=1 Tax=Ziziphus jujuba TaxID=326968 RepID=A0ABM3ZZD7_ZIZJJ|nr:uncharacterized protein LOC132800362 [Ziziphus jujuba]